MSIVSLPETTFDLAVAPQPISNSPQRVLFLGQQSTDASVDEVLITNIQVGTAPTLFGARSMITAMIQAYRQIDQITQIDAIPLNDAGGSTKATSTVSFLNGPASSAGTITIFVQSKVKFQFDVPIALGTTDIQAGTSFAALVNTNTTIGVTATDNADGTVTLTAFNAGTTGNSITISQVNPGTIGMDSTITAFSGGATDPVLTVSIFDQVGDTRYNTLVYPLTYGEDIVSEFLDARFNPTNAIEDGIGIGSATDSSSNFIALAEVIDSQSMVLLANKPVDLTNHKGSAIFEYDPVIASYWAAIRSLRLTSGVNIPNLLIGPLLASNPEGGPNVAAIPYFNTPMSLLPTIDVAHGWTKTEQTLLNNGGVSFIGNNIANNEIIEATMVTTYLTDTQGQPSTSFKFLNTVDTGSQIREFFFNNNKFEYAQAVLTDGDVVVSYQVNVNAFNAFQLSLYKLLSDPPYNLAVAGSAFYQFFKNNITTTFDLSSGVINTSMIVPVVSQVRGINGVVEISFNVITA